MIFADQLGMAGVTAATEALGTTAESGNSLLAPVLAAVSPSLDDIGERAALRTQAHAMNLVAALVAHGFVHSGQAAATGAASATYEVTDMASKIGLGSVIGI